MAVQQDNFLDVAIFGSIVRLQQPRFLPVTDVRSNRTQRTGLSMYILSPLPALEWVIWSSQMRSQAPTPHQSPRDIQDLRQAKCPGHIRYLFHPLTPTPAHPNLTILPIIPYTHIPTHQTPTNPTPTPPTTPSTIHRLISSASPSACPISSLASFLCFAFHTHGFFSFPATFFSW